MWVAPIGESDGVDWAAARAVTDDTDRGIRMFGWAWDGRHLLYVQDAGGDENWRLYDVDLVTGERRDLTPFEKIHAQIIGSSKRRPTEVLVGMNADNPQLHDVYRLDLVTGNLVKEIENPGYAGGWPTRTSWCAARSRRCPTGPWTCWSGIRRRRTGGRC